MLHLTSSNFETEIIHTKSPVVVMFYADWCAKCAMMKPVVSDLEKKFAGKVRFGEVEIEESAELAADYGADNLIPTFILFKQGKPAGILKGLIDENVFEQRIKKIFINC